MHIWPPTDFCCFGLEHAVPIHPIFEACPLNANVVRCWNGHSSSHASFRVHWRGSLSINVFKRSSLNLEVFGVLLMSRRSSLQRENHFLTVLSPMVLSLYMAKMFLDHALLSPSYWTQRKEYVGNVPNFPLGTPFSSLHGSTHYLQMTKSQYVNSRTIILLQIKNGNR